MKFIITSLALVASVQAVTRESISLASLSGSSFSTNGLTPACIALMNQTLQSCTTFPICSSACEDELTSLAASLTITCRQASDPEGLLKTAMTGNILNALCRDNTVDGDSGSSVSSSSLAVVASTKSITLKGTMVAPTSTIAATASGLVVDTSSFLSPSTTLSLAATQSAAVGIVVDTSSFLTVSTTSSKSSPSQTKSSTSESSSQTSDSNGSLFASQPESSSAGRVQASLAIVFFGALALLMQ